MKYKKVVHIAIILQILLFSCEKEIEFKGNEIKTMLVLNGLLVSNSLTSINLTESRFFLDDAISFKNIDNATVELWKDGNRIEKLSNKGEGYYVGKYVLKTGDNIRITASCEGFNPIECSTEIVVPTQIISVDTLNFKEDRQYYYNSDYTEIDSSSYYFYVNSDLYITLQDPKDIPNYYRLNLFTKYTFSNGEILFFPATFNSDDLVFQKGNDISFVENNDFLKSTLFNDELFDGKDYKLKIKASLWGSSKIYYNPNNPDESPDLVGTEIYIELQSLSYPYYMYLKTCDAQANMNGVMEYFSEPVQIYSNVKGGTGILGSYSSWGFGVGLNFK